jgi:oxygen-independent coproporphyrinogen-3 oxidase
LSTHDFPRCPEHLYFHWPFCSKKCHYCDFVAFQNHEQYQDAYHETLCCEVETFAQLTDALKTPIKTIFMGGGTPSLYDTTQMAELFAQLRERYNLSQLEEASIEVNPADVEEERLDAWRECGFTRLSIGVQALDDQLLARLNRRQRTQDVFKAMKLAPKYFDRMSIDLILGMPGVSQQQWKDTLTQAMNWPIEHISIYFLTIHEKTPLYFKVERGEHILPADESVIEMYQYTVEFLAHHGFEQYEISNFAKPGAESTHNKAYWDRKPYKGFGIGSSSFDGKSRFTNHKNLPDYLALYKNRSTITYDTKEVLSNQQALLEHLMLSLRQRNGVGLHSMVYLLNEDQKARFFIQVQELIKASLLEEINGNIRLTIRGMILENEVVISLI